MYAYMDLYICMFVYIHMHIPIVTLYCNIYVFAKAVSQKYCFYYFTWPTLFHHITCELSGASPQQESWKPCGWPGHCLGMATAVASLTTAAKKPVLCGPPGFPEVLKCRAGPHAHGGLPCSQRHHAQRETHSWEHNQLLLSSGQPFYLLALRYPNSDPYWPKAVHMTPEAHSWGPHKVSRLSGPGPGQLMPPLYGSLAPSVYLGYHRLYGVISTSGLNELTIRRQQKPRLTPRCWLPDLSAGRDFCTCPSPSLPCWPKQVNPEGTSRSPPPSCT